MKIEGSVVVVTGAASGIGAALAITAADRGARAVAVIDIDGTGASLTWDQGCEMARHKQFSMATCRDRPADKRTGSTQCRI